jgi:hypothetical protein
VNTLPPLTLDDAEAVAAAKVGLVNRIEARTTRKAERIARP